MTSKKNEVFKKSPARPEPILKGKIIMAKRLPKYFNQTMRDYKRQKRRQLKAIRAAMNEFSLGCAYIPHSAYLKFNEALRAIEKVHKDCKPWWRKA